MPSSLPDSWLEGRLRGWNIPGPYRILTRVAGGSINRALAVETGAGKIFLKLNDRAPEGFFAAEREGLEALAAADSGLVVPRVLGVHDAPGGLSALGLEWLEPAPSADKAAWESFGRGLARLHRFTAKRFGFARDNFLGTTPQPNGWMEDWGAFFAERRIGHLLRLLERSGSLAQSSLRVHRALQERLPALLSHHPPPSLLHGDLWAGNFLPSARGPALVDPAAHHGDRECDLAMMRLFGGFPETAFEAYREAWPLAEGWKERLPVYRLYHLLNHQLLFGEPYGARALSEARALNR